MSTLHSNLRIADKLLAFISSRQEIPLNGPNNIFSLLDNFFMKNKFQDCIIDNNVYYEWLSNRLSKHTSRCWFQNQ